MSALRILLKRDLEFKSFILRQQEEAQAHVSYAENAARTFTDCLTATNVVKDAHAAGERSMGALKEALNHALGFYNDHSGVLTTISSTNGILAAWVEILTLTETLLARLDRATLQMETHLYLATDEQAAHEFASIAASESLLSCTDSLRAVDRSIAQKRRALSGLRRMPTEILQQIFMKAVDARQTEIIDSLLSYSYLYSYSDPKALLETLNLIPFTLTAICKYWRALCRDTPQLWRYARVPSSYLGNKIIGKTQFEQCVRLAQRQPLELTIYPYNNATYGDTTYYDFVLPAESQVLRAIIWHYNTSPIPRGIPSPTELCVVASADSYTPYTQTFPTELLVNTKKLQCIQFTPQINYPVGVQSLHLSLSRQGGLPLFDHLLRNYPQLMELHLESDINVFQTGHPPPLFTHQRLRTLSLMSQTLPWLIYAFSAGCRLPRLAHLILTDIKWCPSTLDIPQTCDQFSCVTHIEVQSVSAPGVVAHFRPLFAAATALHTLTLVGSAVEPMLNMLASSTPKRVEELIVCDSNANDTTLRDYLVAIEQDGGDTTGIKVMWKNCPNFLTQYGMTYGELSL
jgi:F-box-like